MIEVNRHISIYEKNDGKYIGQILLDNVKLEDLQLLVTIDKYRDDDLLYDCYKLNKIMLDKLATLNNEKINFCLDDNEYFLEATAK